MDTPTVIRWLSSTSGRSKRSEEVTVGCYMLEHDATGRFYVGESNSVSRDVDKQLALLLIGKHPCKLLNGLCERDSAVRVYEYPTKSKRACKAIINDLKQSAANDYLCLNP